MRNGLTSDSIDTVILGCAAPPPDTGNPARVAAIRLGLGASVAALSLQRDGASGLLAIDMAREAIATGQADVVLAGGAEAPSRAPILVGPQMAALLADWRSATGLTAKARVLGRLRTRHLMPDTVFWNRLTDPLSGLSAGQAVEELAHHLDITRAAADRFAATAHVRAASARSDGRLTADLVPVIAPDGTVHHQDEAIRPDAGPDIGADADATGVEAALLEILSGLPPSVEPPHGMVTAGNSAPDADGAGWLVLAGEEAVRAHGLPVLGRIADMRWSARPPRMSGLGAAHASRALLQRLGRTSSDIDLWEWEETSAIQLLSCLSVWSDDDPAGPAPSPEVLNTDGGSLGLGHAAAATGVRQALHLLRTMRRRDARRGMVALCAGGGQGGALMLEREAAS